MAIKAPRAKKRTTYSHDSLSGMVDWINTTERTWKSKAGHSSETMPSDSSWDLNTDYPAALRLAQDGWREGAQGMATKLDMLPALQSMPRASYGVAGGSVNVGRMLSGNPMCMRSRKRQAGHKPALTLVVGISTSRGVNAECAANYGLAIARYCQELDQQGYSVEVVAAIVQDDIDSDNRLIHTWTVKQQGQAMNFADMAFSIGHPACFRRIGFAAMERSNCKEMSSYGMPRSPTRDDLPERYRDAIILDGINSANKHSRTADSAVEALGEVLTKAMAGKEEAYA